MYPRRKTSGAALSLLGAALFVFTLNVSASAQAQRAPLTTLQSAGVLETTGLITSITSGDDETLYVTDGPTGEADSYTGGPDGSFRHLGRKAGAVRGPRGYSASAGKNFKLTVWDAAGKVAAEFTTLPASSFAFLGNGHIVVASPINDRLLHVYSPSGRLLKSFGSLKDYDGKSDAQNRFLHQGKVLVDAADNIYYVYRYVPVIQKYTAAGALDFEVEVEGEAVDLQLEVAERFLNNKGPQTVGGISVINSAAIDRGTGRLWLALSGSSNTGVVYEYSARGKKLNEYALEVDSPSPQQERRIVGVADITVSNSAIYVLTVQRQVHRFNKVNGPVGRLGGESMTQRHASFSPAGWLAALSPAAQTGCGPAQEWPNCGFNCPGVTCANGQPTTTSSNSQPVDCKAHLMAALSTGYTVIAAPCTPYPVGTMGHTRGGCKGDVTICRSGTNSSHTVTIDCATPAPGSCQAAGGEWVCDPVCQGFGRNFGKGLFVKAGYAPARPAFNVDPCCMMTPVVIDVLGDGFSLTGPQEGVQFDFNGDGITTGGVSWTVAASDDAWLVLDRNGNGAVDGGAELFGNATPQTPSAKRHGFNALADYDAPANGGNGDGLLDAADSVYASLRLWQDTNHNGVSEQGELHTLPALGVNSISLEYRESRRRDQHGNEFRYRAKVNGKNKNGVGRWAYDVILVAAP